MRYSGTRIIKKDNKKVYSTTFYPKIPLRDDDIFVKVPVGTRLDALAHQYYNDTSLWWIIARANGLKGTELQLNTGPKYRIPMSIQSVLRDFKSLNRK